jgi:hypothetical protein
VPPSHHKLNCSRFDFFHINNPFLSRRFFSYGRAGRQIGFAKEFSGPFEHRIREVNGRLGVRREDTCWRFDWWLITRHHYFPGGFSSTILTDMLVRPVIQNKIRTKLYLGSSVVPVGFVAHTVTWSLIFRKFAANLIPFN